MAIWVRLGAVPFTRRRDLVPGRPEQGLGQREHGLLQGADLVRHIVLGRVIFATVSWISVCPGCERSSPASGSSWPARCPSTVSSWPPAAVTCWPPAAVTCWLIVSSLPVTSAKRPLAVSSRPSSVPSHLGAPLDRRDLLVELTGPLGEFGHDLVQAAEASCGRLHTLLQLAHALLQPVQPLILPAQRLHGLADSVGHALQAR